MEMDEDRCSVPSGMRRDTIATTIDQELQRQAQAGAERIDVHAMAEAIDLALFEDAEYEQFEIEGRPMSELNASNDI